MQIPLQVVFRHMNNSPMLEHAIREKAKKLETYCQDIVSCRVVVDMPNHHHPSGNVYVIQIQIKVPGREIIVSAEPAQHPDCDEINAVLQDAFDSARRQLADYAQEHRGEIKTHKGDRGSLVG